MKINVSVLSIAVILTAMVGCGTEEVSKDDQIISIEDATKEDLMDENNMIVVTNDSVGPSSVSAEDIIMLEDVTEADLMDENKIVVVVNPDSVSK